MKDKDAVYFSVIALVLVFLLTAGITGLKGRVDDLEKRVRALEAR